MPIHRQTITSFGFLSSIATFPGTSTKSKTHKRLRAGCIARAKRFRSPRGCIGAAGLKTTPFPHIRAPPAEATLSVN
jgi:hypothetical protein